MTNRTELVFILVWSKFTLMFILMGILQCRYLQKHQRNVKTPKMCDSNKKISVHKSNNKLNLMLLARLELGVSLIIIC